jgi:hypothetical protein
VRAQPRRVRLRFVEAVEHGQQRSRCVLERREIIDVFVLQAADEFLEEVIGALTVGAAEGSENIFVNVLTCPLLDRDAEFVEIEGRLLLLSETGCCRGKQRHCEYERKRLSHV